MPVLTAFQVASAAKLAGWEDVLLPWAVMTSYGESGWDTDAIGHGSDFGDPSHNYYGLMQLSDVHKDRYTGVFPPSEGWKNPVVNFTIAREIYQGEGKSAFSGRPEHPKYGAKAQSKSGEAVMAARQVIDLNMTPNPTIGGLTVNDPNATTTVVGGKIGDAIDGALGGVTDGLAKIAWIAGGSLMVILGLLLLFKSQTPVGKIASVFK